ncbi:hypothetical protein ACFVWR_07880 [Leifsonia sp. NPDC058292]|uniref:hypothetical protein n=1 Tax=Leifsonia sp. NPDC058292 TaxID=3346428 RepID=UPI0036DAC2AD
MNVTLLSLVQGVGVVVLATVAFTLALTWPTVIASISGMRSERSRMLTFAGLGFGLLLTTVPLYLAPGLLLRDGFEPALALMLAVTWLIAVASLVVRGLLLSGFQRVVSFAFAVIAGSGLIAGFISAVCAQHRIADTITPTGAFLLVVAAIAGIVFWSSSDLETPAVSGRA